MKKFLAAPALLAVALALPACKKNEPANAAPAAAPTAEAPATTSPAPAPASAPPVDAQMAPAPEDPSADFDKGAFSGSFGNGPIRLDLHGDGTYGFDVRGAATTGTWTYEADTRVIRLDPGSKGVEDQVLRVDGKDKLTPVPAPGQENLPVLARVAAS